MTDRPILFSPAMVRALIAGHKTQTRRLATSRQTQRIEIGDRLWVREDWCVENHLDHVSPSQLPNHPDSTEGCEIGYRATMPLAALADPVWGRRRASMHMPRWASRLTLIVTDKRIQPLQDISETEALAEGIYPGWGRPKRTFSELWNSLHDKPGERWQDNPDVIAISFIVKHGNIDGLAS